MALHFFIYELKQIKDAAGSPASNLVWQFCFSLDVKSNVM